MSGEHRPRATADPFTYYRRPARLELFVVSANMRRLVQIAEMADVAGMHPSAFGAFLGMPPAAWRRQQLDGGRATTPLEESALLDGIVS